MIIIALSFQRKIGETFSRLPEDALEKESDDWLMNGRLRGCKKLMSV